MDITSFIFGFISGVVILCTIFIVVGVYVFVSYGKRTQERNKEPQPTVPKFQFWDKE